jgi:pimeloyl-ACP methyl ester carboxylesterase
MQDLVTISKSFSKKNFHHGKLSFPSLTANESAEKAIVIVHGVTGNKYDMVVVGREYTRKGYAVYIPDLPGHGDANPIKVTGFNDLSDWLHTYMQAIGRTPDLLMGNSFGSAICYSFARRGLMAESTRLILACPTPEIAPMSRALRRASGLLPENWISAQYNAAWAIRFRTLYLLTGGSSEAKRWLEESERWKIAFLDVKVANDFSMLLQTDNPYRLSPLPTEVQKRTMVAVGAKDNVITKGALPLLRELLPQAQFVVIPRVGHILHFEAYKELSKLVA